MRFLCICLSPAIDATVRMDAWPTDGRIIKNAADTFAPGGKTVNVARWLAKRGDDSCLWRERVGTGNEWGQTSRGVFPLISRFQIS